MQEKKNMGAYGDYDMGVYEEVKTAFANFEFLARTNVQKQEKFMSESDKGRAKSALVFLGQLAENPAMYFSRAATEDAWNKRVKEYAAKHNIPDQNLGVVYMLAQGPKEIALEKAQKSFHNNHSLFSLFYSFCKAVQDWEYFRTSKDVNAVFGYKNALKEISIIKKTAMSMVELQKTNPMFRPIKKVVQSFQKEK